MIDLLDKYGKEYKARAAPTGYWDFELDNPADSLKLPGIEYPALRVKGRPVPTCTLL